MSRFIDELRSAWSDMMQPPWRHPVPDMPPYEDSWGFQFAYQDALDARKARKDHWEIWLVGWAWALAGLLLGALVSPTVLRGLGLASSPYQGYVSTAVAVLAGFIVQLLGWCLTALALRVDKHFAALGALLALLAYPLPLTLVGFTIYGYLTWIGPGQRTVTVAFARGLLVNVFVIPAITGAFKSRAFKLLVAWLRSDKAKAKGAG